MLNYEDKREMQNTCTLLHIHTMTPEDYLLTINSDKMNDCKLCSWFILSVGNSFITMRRTTGI